MLLLFFTIFYCSYLSMHEVKKPFAGIEKLSIWHGKPFFLLQKPFFLKIKPFKKTFFFHKVELTAWSINPITQANAASQWSIVTL